MQNHMHQKRMFPNEFLILVRSSPIGPTTPQQGLKVGVILTDKGSRS